MMEGSSSTTQQTTPSRPLPFREDCWSEEATSTLVDVWGRRYMELNRGNLRQKDWQEVADAVNALHGVSKKTIRTDVQCKNRIDTLKKKYKTEKAKIVESNGTLTSSWPFYSRLDVLVGPNYNKQQIQSQSSSVKLQPLGSSSSPSPSPPSSSLFGLNSPLMALPLPYKKPLLLPPPPMATLHPQMMVTPQKRSSPGLGPAAMDDSYFRRNYSAMAAAAAATKKEEEEDEVEGSEDEMENEEVGSEEADEEVEGISSLAKAIERFSEIYERVEKMKQRQMVEMEKQRMQFTQDLEIQRMQMFADTKIHLEKLKRAKRSGSDDLYN